MESEVRATCETCGTVQVEIGHVQLVLARPDLDADRRNVLEFRCPSCRSLVRSRVSDRSTQLLASAGVLLVADSQAASSLPTTSRDADVTVGPPGAGAARERRERRR
jgi:hypothetical protein